MGLSYYKFDGRVEIFFHRQFRNPIKSICLISGKIRLEKIIQHHDKRFVEN